MIIDNNPPGATSRYLVARLAPDGTVPPIEVVSETKVSSEGRSVSIGFLTLISNWLASHSYQHSDLAFQHTVKAWAPFGGFDGNWSHSGKEPVIAVEADTAMVEVAYQRPFDNFRLLTAGFVEAGIGKNRLEGDFKPVGQYLNRGCDKINIIIHSTEDRKCNASAVFKGSSGATEVFSGPSW
ncbi:MAG: hypothetical protein LBT47_09070 [Deltaproteobacteria bacterium]|jgi:hypothetical protein|nr:hypothetical protein [Deltaproteobacteria bacterium]